MIASLALFVARCSITVWVGAAVLFVVVSVREVTSPAFDSTIRDQLVVLRFPLFYTAGLTLLTLTTLSCLVLWTVKGTSLSMGPRRRGVVTLLVVIALFGMTWDYVSIYRPLTELITPPGKPRTETFRTLHEWSTRINSANLLLCLVAAGLLNWPTKNDRRLP